MTSHPDPESTTPEPDGDDSSNESPEQQSVPAVESDAVESDAEATIAGPHASGPPADEPTVVDDPGTVLPVSNTDADPEKTLVKKLEGVLEEFAQTLASEHQDLDRTLPTTSLKPVVDSESAQRSRHESFSQSRSVRPRSIQTADRRIEDAGSNPAADTKSPDSDLDYVTLNKLGEGGMGTVHLARQVALGREVALKQIHQQSSRRQSVRDEFLTEASLTGKLEHPHIVPIYEVGESAGGELFYSMKNVKGRAWEETIDDLTLDQNLEILIDVCDAIAFAHAEGVIHRDLKPQNIMTGGFGEVLVLDWGLAVLGVSGEDVKASPGGTPCYMAPDVVNPPFLVGPRSDVYLLGAILFRFLTGQAPHAGQSARAAMKSASKNEIVNPDRERIQDLDPTGKLLSVAMQAMATDPADRYQTVGEFQQAVREFEAHQESLKLAVRAEEALESAEQSGEYTQYSRSMIGFEEAVTLWAGNATAKEGIERSRQAYALRAEQNEDYELGLSLLDESVPEQQAMAQRLTIARDERNARQGRLKRMKQGLAVTAGLIFVIVGSAAFWINKERVEANRQRQIAEDQRIAADTQRSIAVTEKDKAERNSYVSDMHLVQRDWNDMNIGHLKSLLNRHAERDDLKGFEWNYWVRLVSGDLLTLKGHNAIVFSVCFSPDGKQLASASADETVHVWNVVTGQKNLVIDGHGDTVRSVCFSPDGKRLATATFRFVKLWDAGTGQLIRTFKGHTATVYSACFSPDGRQIASASVDNTVKLWDASTGEELHTLKGHTYRVRDVCFSPDGRQIASASFDNTVKVWDSTTGQQTLTVKGHASGVNSLSFSPDGTRLASASADHTVKLWNAVVSKESLTDQGRFDCAKGICFNSDGQQMALASYKKSIIVCDTHTGLDTLVINGMRSEVNSVCFDRNNTLLLSGSTDGTLSLWDASNGTELLVIKGHMSHVPAVSFSPDSQRIASGSWDGTVKLWDSTTGQELLAIAGVVGYVNDVCFSPDGKRLASATSEPTVKLWDTVSGAETLALTGHTDWVRSVCFSLDGKHVASASADNTVKVWDAVTGRENLTLKGHAGAVNSVCFSPNGKRLASVSDDQTVKVWDAVTGEETLTLKGHDGAVTSVCFSLDGTRLASAGKDGKVKLWDARPWTPELRAQSQARSLLTAKQEKMKSLEDLQASIRSDRTISDLVRQLALGWSEQFWKHRPLRDTTAIPEKQP